LWRLKFSRLLSIDLQRVEGFFIFARQIARGRGTHSAEIKPLSNGNLMPRVERASQSKN
jgi:hypothetical protein